MVIEFQHYLFFSFFTQVCSHLSQPYGSNFGYQAGQLYSMGGHLQRMLIERTLRPEGRVRTGFRIELHPSFSRKMLALSRPSVEGRVVALRRQSCPICPQLTN